MEAISAASLFFVVGVILFAARVAGGLARRLGQPRVLGELLIGVILGPTVLDLLHAPLLHGASLEPIIKYIAEIGVVLLMFLVGLEVNLKELAQVGRVGVLGGVLGAIIPVVLTVPVMLLFQYEFFPAVFAGVTLAATSVSISAQVLLELGILRTKIGNALLATALVDDIVAIVLVSLTIAIGTSSSATLDISGLLGIILQMALYLVIGFLIAWFILPPVVNWVSSQPYLAQNYGIPILALMIAMLFAWSAEALGGVATITGSFIAGVGLSRVKHHAKQEIENVVSSLAYVIFVPIFFIDVGLSTNLAIFPLSALPFALVVLVVAVVSKIGGCGWGALLGGFNRDESLRLGVCMVARGEVGLIIASLGLTMDVFHRESPIFSVLFLVILVTTLMTPFLVRMIFPSQGAVPQVAKG